MELSEAEKIIKNSFLFKDANEHIQLKEAISTVLQALEELQVEKNHLLLVDLSNEKKISNEENRRCMLLAIENNDLKEKVANSISKDKIKEKIVNLKVSQENTENDNLNREYQYQIDVLEELVKGE